MFISDKSCFLLRHRSKRCNAVTASFPTISLGSHSNQTNIVHNTNIDPANMAAMNTPAAYDQTVYKQPLDFIDIYKNNVFGGVESRSGNGSTLEQTAVLREELPKLFKELGIRSIVDAPCGDFNWMQHVITKSPGVKYTGVDIVPDLIKEDAAKYTTSDNTIEFRVGSIITDVLPAADLVICRDCLVHLRIEDGLKAIKSFRKAGFRYLLSTTFTKRDKNEENFIRGLWRALNLEKAPFDLGPAEKLINENCTEAGDFLADKCLGLWDLQKT